MGLDPPDLVIAERTPPATDRVRGLDAIRFICALWVFFGHGGAPPLPNPFSDGSFANFAFRGFYGNLWSGAAAVIVFFVISGFCIHYPFAGSDRRPRLAEFYTRRFLRLLIPVLLAIPLSRAAGIRMTLFQDSILWSLVAELIYYLVYPLLRAAQLRFGSWHGLVMASFVLALVITATNPSAGDYPSFGPALNWLIGLPCWLLGCVLAELTRTAASRDISTTAIWSGRAVVLAAACFCSVLRYHSPLGYPWTLNFFALLVTVWLRQEIQFRQRVAPPRLLEWAGLWSYSLYLVHVPAMAVFKRRLSPGLHPALEWGLMILFVFGASYLFYLVCERPSHIIARRTARHLRARGTLKG